MFAEGTHSETYDEGLRIRKEVLGDEHVERSLERSSAFGRAAQNYATELCWGAIWGRPGLERTERSLLNLGILTALNRMHEFGVHVRGAIRNGVTVSQIHEAILQAGMYVGIPAALESFRVAEQVIRDELGDEAVENFIPAEASQ